MATDTPTAHPLSAVPDDRGRFGEFGRRYVPETLMYALDELAQAYEDAKKDPEFDREFRDLLKNYVGRPKPALLCGTTDRKMWRCSDLV